MATVWLAALAVALQTPADLARTLTQDTSRPVHRARSAQELFERDRRGKLPISSGGSGKCDERIGRFCYWYEDGDTAVPDDPAAVRAARSRLLATLASVERDRPESDWVVGQRVRYLIEQGQVDSAIGAALRCGATRWWCDALSGLSHHAAQRFAEADSLFDRAIGSMPESIRCAWTDWTVAFTDPLAKRSTSGDCATRAAIADTAFWLGQPLLGRPGNDLRTEFFSRRVMASLHAVAKSPHLIPWGRDMEELMLRYGWSTRFSVSESRPGSLEPPSVIGHQRSPAYHFFPVADRKEASSGWRWDLAPDRPRARYAPAYADRFTVAERYQIARFPRGDSTVIVAGMDVSADTAFLGRALDVSLAVSRGPREMVAVRRDSTGRAAGMIAVTAGQPRLAGIEAAPHAGKVFLRARVVLDPVADSASLVVSDALLFTPDEGLPESLEEAAARALPSGRISRARPVGIYWETSGPASTDDSLGVAVAVLPVRRGLLGRLGEGLSVVKRKAPLTLQWRARGDGQPVLGRSIELDLGRLRPGRYLLRLEIRSDRGSAITERPIELTP